MLQLRQKISTRGLHFVADALHRRVRKRVQSESIEALSSTVLASRSNAQFTKEQPFGCRRMHGALHDFDQRGFIAASCREFFGLGDYRTHDAVIMAQWICRWRVARTNGFGAGIPHPGSSPSGRISMAAPLSGAEFPRWENWSARRRDSARGWFLIGSMIFNTLELGWGRMAVSERRLHIANWTVRGR